MNGKILIVAAAASILYCTGALSVSSEREQDAGHADHQELSGAAGGHSQDSVYHLETRWLNEAGDDFVLSSLAPRPVVAAMVYTSCEYACPIIIGRMISVYHALHESERDRVRFVLFSFDPRRDTPDKLNPYKKQKNIDKPQWMVLTSTDEDAPLELAVALGIRYKPLPDGNFAHSNIITVLNGQGVPVHQMIGMDRPVDKVVEAVRGSI